MERYAFVVVSVLLLCLEKCESSEDIVVCTSTLKSRDCPKDTYYRENVKSNNFCPGCIPLKDFGQKCVKDEDCAPGLSCQEAGTSGSGKLIKRCSYDKKQDCEYYKRTDEIYLTTNYWEPDCLPNGKYAAKQCKGEKLWGKCFCRNEEGTRIFGEKAWIDAANMTCACSRLADRLRRTRMDVSLHCDEEGNFEPLQCDNGICWCANERTGKPYTPVVPEWMTRILPCFEENTFGSQYLRRCDSSHVHTERAIKILKNHGLEIAALPRVNCNYDGSFARVQTEGKKRYCAYKDKKRLCQADEKIVNCNCLYDKWVAGINEKEFNMECDDNGSYKSQQIVGNVLFKVDSDGCPYSVEETGI